MYLRQDWTHSNRFRLPMHRRFFRLAVYVVKAERKARLGDVPFLQKTPATQPEADPPLLHTHPLQWTRNPGLSLPRMGLQDGRAGLGDGRILNGTGGYPRW